MPESHRPQGYFLGHWKAKCDQCGVTFRNDQLRLQWNGLRTCSGPGTFQCWEPRHPQEFLRGKKDDQAPPWTRPDQDGTDVSVGSGNEITPDDL